MDQPLETRVAAIAALDEPNRRRLYEYIAGQSEAVSRDDAAAAVALPRTTAAFHLDRLVDEGLLDVVYARRTGRRGPGAGRPAKLYRRSERQVTVSLPDRRYDVAGWLLAAAVEEAEESADSPRTALDQRAHQLGSQVGAAANTAPRQGEQGDVTEALRAYGFEPRDDGRGLVLGNCPFHSLATRFPELVCGMNVRFLDGLLHGLGATGLRACLDPAPGQCCVRIRGTHDIQDIQPDADGAASR